MGTQHLESRNNNNNNKTNKKQKQTNQQKHYGVWSKDDMSKVIEIGTISESIELRIFLFAFNFKFSSFYDFANFIIIEKNHFKICNVPPDHM